MTRRVILQMQMTVDGFMQATDGQRWQMWDWGPQCTWDRALQEYFNQVYADADTILLSRDMAVGGFIDHWRRIGLERAEDPGFDFARRVGSIEKLIATRQLFSPPWERARVLTRELRQEIAHVKGQSGGNILAFGGIRFASKLLSEGLVDELQLFINPAILGEGQSIFDATRKRLRLLGSEPYDCGIVVNRYAFSD